MTTVNETDRPLISVIIPFGDERSKPGHIATWTRKQTLPAERFEVVVLTGPLTAPGRDELTRFLRPHDRLLVHDSFEQFHMYALGAKAARAPLLFVTEDHCLAEPHCLEAVGRHFEDPAAFAATMRWGDFNRSWVGRMEELVNEANIPVWFEPGHWNRVRIRGFAIRREVYEAVGGFPGRYGHFDEAVLAARLHAGGYRVDLIQEKGVRHVNTLTLAASRANARSYTLGECEYVDSQDPEFCERYFQGVSVLRKASPARGDGIPLALSALGAALRHGTGTGPVGRMRAVTALAGQLFGELARYAGGSARTRLGARLALLGARIRLSLPWASEQRRVRAFEDYWAGVVRLVRADYTARHPRPAPTGLPVSPAGTTFAPDRLPTANTVEQYRGQTFRWTAPVDTFRFLLPEGSYRVEIDTGGIRGAVEALPLWLFWNRRRVRERGVVRQDGRIAFTAEVGPAGAGGAQRLDLVTTRLAAGTGDRRRLGLPVVSLRVAPVEVVRVAADRHVGEPVGV